MSEITYDDTQVLVRVYRLMETIADLVAKAYYDVEPDSCTITAISEDGFNVDIYTRDSIEREHISYKDMLDPNWNTNINQLIQDRITQKLADEKARKVMCIAEQEVIELAVYYKLKAKFEPNETKLQTFFNNLASKQELLGSDFQQVIDDNYWELVQSSNNPGDSVDNI